MTFGTSNIVNEKLKKDDRVLILEPIQGKQRDASGQTDPRLFNGDNRLHIIRLPNNLWYFKYDKGTTPAPLRNKYTNFQSAYAAAEEYYRARNVLIVRVED